MSDYYSNDDLFQDPEDVQGVARTNLVVYSRDWTIQTIFDQIEQGNIELNPGFQRRNAWNDEKRSKLIESILIGYPVPEIVLAEDARKKRSFIVIDGKQRLLTVAGFVNNEKYKYWTSKTPSIKGESVFHGIKYTDILDNAELKRVFENSSLRCTVISNYSSENELYDIFFRLNAASTPLATQELRQALYRGSFADFLINETDTNNPIRTALGIDGPDKRLRDVEVLLRLISFINYASKYSGNLLRFLDETMDNYNKQWEIKEEEVRQTTQDIYEAISLFGRVVGDEKTIGKRFKDGELETRFNRVLFEVEVFYFTALLKMDRDEKCDELFKPRFMTLCDNPQFRSSLEGSTKSMENYRIRYSMFKDLLCEVYGKDFMTSPF